MNNYSAVNLLLQTIEIGPKKTMMTMTKQTIEMTICTDRKMNCKILKTKIKIVYFKEYCAGIYFKHYIGRYLLACCIQDKNNWSLCHHCTEDWIFFFYFLNHLFLVLAYLSLYVVYTASTMLFFFFQVIVIDSSVSNSNFVVNTAPSVTLLTSMVTRI